MTGKSFVDVELPQVRHSSHPSTFKRYKGAESWMNLPDYPKMPKEHNAGESLAYDYLANFPSWNTQRLVAEGADLSKMESTSYAGGSAISFIAGVVVAFVVMQLVNRQSKAKKQGYQVVPEAVPGEN